MNIKLLTPERKILSKLLNQELEGLQKRMTSLANIMATRIAIGQKIDPYYEREMRAGSNRINAIRTILAKLNP